MQNAVCVDEGVADALLCEILVHAREVPALRQPYARGRAAQRVPVALDRQTYLGANGRRELLHQRKVTVRGAAGDEVQLPRIAERAEGLNEVQAVLLSEDPAAVGEEVTVHLRQRPQPGILAVPLDLTLGEFDQTRDVVDVSLLEQRILQHRDEWRRERQRQAEVDAVVRQPLERADKRDVRLGDRLEEPVFLKEALVLGVPDVRQMCMQNEA